jgi:hypothetical protein
VAVFTLAISVLSFERKACHGVIKLHVRLPAAFAMAFDALFAKLAFVRIIFLVAGDARRRRLDAMRVFDVALGACNALVFAHQWKFGLRIMVEADLGPAARAVAFVAFGTVAGLVNVLLDVTRHAVRCHLTPTLA